MPTTTLTQIETAAELFRSGKAAEADSICKNILQDEWNNATALHLRGVIAYQAANYTAAIKYLSQSDSLISNNTHVIFALSASHENLNHWASAIQYSKRLLDLEPTSLAIRLQLAHQYEKNSQLDTALTELISICRINESDETLIAIAKIYSIQHNSEKVILYARKFESRMSNNELMWNDLGIIYNTINRHEAALYAFKMSIQVQSSYINPVYNLASLFHENGDIALAERYYIKALKLDTTDSDSAKKANYNLGLIYLGRGNLNQGWKHLQKRPKQYVDVPTINQIKDKRLLIIREEGIGDELTFIRYFPILKKYCSNLDYICHPKLTPLLKNLVCIDELIESENDSRREMGYYDYRISLFDVASIIQTEISHIPAPIQLHPVSSNHPLIKKIQSLNPANLIGITWRAGVEQPEHHSEKYLVKSISLNLLTNMLKNHSENIVILQRNPTKLEIEILNKEFPGRIIDASAFNDHLDLMLELLGKIDHYLGVSNTNMHLFGSLQKQANVIVPYPAEWRWMNQSTKSAWYPNFLLHKQKSKNNWLEVLENYPDITTN